MFFNLKSLAVKPTCICIFSLPRKGIASPPPSINRTLPANGPVQALSTISFPSPEGVDFPSFFFPEP